MTVFFGTSLPLPHFGKRDPEMPDQPDQEELARQLKETTQALSDAEYQRQLAAMPLDDLFIQYGQLKGQQATLTHGGKAGVPKEVVVPVQQSPFAPPQPMSVPVEMVLGSDDPNVLEAFSSGFKTGLAKSIEDMTTSLQERAQQVLDELRSRLTVAEALGRDEVPYQPAAKKDDKTPPGISTGTVRTFLERAES